MNVLSSIEWVPIFAADGSMWIPVLGVLCCLSLLSPLIFWGYVRRIRDEMRTASRYEEERNESAALEEQTRQKVVLFKGEKVPIWKTSARKKATKAILKFLSYTDNWFEKKYIADVADEAFRLVKEAIEARSIQGIEKRVTPECLEEIRTQVKKHRKAKEINVFGKVLVTDVEVLQVEAPTGKENHTFTALIWAKSKDFVEHEETGDLVRGDKKTYLYQEFWTFRRSGKRWLVELIRPSLDVDDVLQAKNVLAKIDRAEFAKDADPEFLKEVVAR